MEQLSKDFYSDIYPHLRSLEDVSLEADGDLTVKLITKTINTYSHSRFIKYCVSVINSISKNEFEFCKNLFDLTNRLVRYRKDPEGHEIVFTPLLLILVGKGDCKKITTWICSVLKCKGIVSADKVVNYDEPFRWQHIYAIAWPKGYKGTLILDPVNYEMFNQEVQYRVGRVNFYDGTYSKYIMTKLSMMGNVPNKNETFLGLGAAADEFLGDVQDISGMRRTLTPHHIHKLEQEYIEGVHYDEISGPDDDMNGLDEIGKKSKKEKKAKRTARHEIRKAKRKKIFKGLKKVGLAPVRIAFLLLIGAGDELVKATHGKIKFNLAVKIAELWKKDNGRELIKLWEQFGGKPEALKNAIIKHSHTQLSGAIYGIPINNDGINGIGTAAAVLAAVTASAPILGKLISMFHKHKLLKKGDALEAIDTVDNLEDKHTDANGNLNPNILETIKSNIPIVNEVMKLDDGGNKPAQDEIKKSVTPNDKTEGEAKQNFTSETPQSKQSQPEQGGGSEEKPEKPEADKPAEQTHAGFNLLGASSWLTGSFYVQIIASSQNINETLSNSVGVIMLTVSLYLFTKTK